MRSSSSGGAQWVGDNKTTRSLGSGGRDAYRYAMHDETDREHGQAWRHANDDSWNSDVALARRLQNEEEELEAQRRRTERESPEQRYQRREDQMRRDEEMARALANEGTRPRESRNERLERQQSDEEYARRLQEEWSRN